MRLFSILLSLVPVVMSSVPVALAHDAAPGQSGFLHAVTGFDHFIGFVVIGAMVGAYLRLFGGRPYILLWVVPFVLLASHGHMPVFTGTGVVFAMGFMGAGLLIGIIAACMATALVERLGVGPPRVQPGGRPVDRDRSPD